MDSGSGSRGTNMTVPSATSAIVVSNPISKRFVTKVSESKPEVRVVVTEQQLPDVARGPGISRSSLEIRPRRARKMDLAKSLSDFHRVKSVPGAKVDPPPDREHFLILGDSGPGSRGVDTLSPAPSYSLPKFVEDGAVVYVQCPECKKRLKQKSYRSHLRTHLGVKQYKCDLCGDGFTRKNDVKRHHKLIHDKPRNHQCDLCHKYFITEENLKVHKIKHNNELKCRVCDHGFGKREYFENHIKFVHPDGRGPQMIPCNDDDESDVDSPAEQEDCEPAILRRSDKRKSQSSIPYHDIKKSNLILLGDLPPSPVDESSKTASSKTPTVTIKDSQSKQSHIIKSSAETKAKLTEGRRGMRVGQLVQMEDGTFIIVNCGDGGEEEAGEQPQEESQVDIHNISHEHNNWPCRTLSRLSSMQFRN